MSDEKNQFYISVEGLEKDIEVNEDDYKKILNHIHAGNLKLVGIQPKHEPNKLYSVPTRKINYFYKEELRDDQEMIKPIIY